MAAESLDYEPVDVIDTPEMAVMRADIIKNLDECLLIIHSLSKYLETINESLGGGKYASELRILENYKTSFNRSLKSYTSL